MSAAPIGKFVWYEYMGTDVGAAVDFYTHVVGWATRDGGRADFRYDVVTAGGHPVGGVMAIPADAKAMGARPAWLAYVWVENVDLALPKLMEAGGKVFKAPFDIPGIGRFAVVADPYGGTFMLFRDFGGNPPAAGRSRDAGDHRLARVALRRRRQGARLLLPLLRLVEDQRLRHGPDGRLPDVQDRRRARRAGS